MEPGSADPALGHARPIDPSLAAASAPAPGVNGMGVSGGFAGGGAASGGFSFSSVDLKNQRKRDVARLAASALGEELTTKRAPGVLPKAVVDCIERAEKGPERGVVKAATVIRTPVAKYVGSLLDVVTLGKYKESIAESPYDAMFHLSMLINFQYILQKNEVISLAEIDFEIADTSEMEPVDLPDNPLVSPPITLRALLDNTRDHMGADLFSDYDARFNNCQDFILGVLRGNALATPALESFVKQEAELIFAKLPGHTSPLAKALTDAAAVGDKVLEDLKRVEVAKKMRERVASRKRGEGPISGSRQLLSGSREILSGSDSGKEALSKGKDKLKAMRHRR